MDEAQGRKPSLDDTAAFQRFYAGAPEAKPPPPQRGLLYRVFVGWWHDRD